MLFAEPGVVAPEVRFFAGIDGGGTPDIVDFAIVEFSPDIENHLMVVGQYRNMAKHR